MRRQARPFIVEVKQRRSGPRRDRSIWGDLDLAAVAAEATRDLEENELSNRGFIDSDRLSSDAENSHSLQAEHHMADPQEAESVVTFAEAPANVETPEPRKRGPRQRKAKAQSARPGAAEPPAATVRTGRKVHSKEERAQKLGQIEKTVGQGGSLKSAVKQAGISEQTYYQWKKAAEAAAPAGDLKDLLALEEENGRLKKLLAERLRKENAELRKKLGLK